jgi:hypothetical protein
MSNWGAVTWDVARAGGFTAYVLLTLAVAVGLTLTLQWQSARWPRLISSDLHNYLSLLSLIFAGIHVAAVWIDPFTRFGWNEVFVPLASHYRPLWMALGIVGLYLGLAIGLSTWVRPLIGYSWWRRLHVLTLAVFAGVTVHGIATGSDTRTWWGVGIYGASVLLIGVLLAVRLLVPVNERGRTYPVIAGAIGLATLAGLVWTLRGPLQPGWNAAANNGQGSGSRNGAVAAGVVTQDPFTSTFTATAQGTLSRNGPDARGIVTLEFRATLSGGAVGYLDVQMRGQQAGNGTGDDGSSGTISITSTTVTLGNDASTPLYQGQLTRFSQDTTWQMTAQLSNTSGNQIQVRILLQVTDAGQVSGTVTGSPH